MRRKTLDLLLNWVGLLLTVMLLVAGTGLVVGYSFYEFPSEVTAS